MLKTVSSITNAIGALNFKGTWNAATNTPTIVSGVGVKGDYFVVSVAGSTTIDGISNWGVGDWITYNGTVWQRVEGGADLNGVNLSVSGTTTLSGLTASTALALNASKEIVSVTNTGTGDNVLGTSPTLTTPRVVTSINDTNGNELIAVTATASAVNELTVANAATGAGPTLSATGSDTNIAINLTPKGTGRTNSNGISRITVSEGVMQELYSTSTAIFTGSSVAKTDIYGSDGGEAVIAYQDWRSNNNHSTGSRGMRLYIALASGVQQTATDKFWLDEDGGPRPVANNSVSLGAASNLWSEVFAGNNVINTSDARKKTPVRELNAAEIAAAKDLGKEIGAFKFLSAIDEKGDAARTHIGMTVQRAIEIMESHGLDPMSYGFICFDQWDEIVHQAAVEEKDAVLDEEGNIIEPAVQAREAVVQPAGEQYGFRTDQLLLFIARGFEARLSALEGA